MVKKFYLAKDNKSVAEGALILILFALNMPPFVFFLYFICVYLNLFEFC